MQVFNKTLTLLILSLPVLSYADRNKNDFIASSDKLAQYSAILVEEVSVNYAKEPSKNKHRMAKESNYPLSDERLAKLKGDISQMVIESFTEDGEFTEANEAGSHVLKIKIALNDVRITTPTLEQKQHLNSKHYVQTPIHVTLEGEFNDATTGEVVAKFTKKRINTNRFDYFYLSTNSRDNHEIRKTIRHWVKRMQKKFAQKRVAMVTVMEYEQLFSNGCNECGLSLMN